MLLYNLVVNIFSKRSKKICDIIFFDFTLDKIDIFTGRYSNLFPYFHIPSTTDSNIDLNTLTTEGIYTIRSGYANGPEGNNCLLIVITSVGTPSQLWMGDNLYTLYKRCSLQDGRFTGSWTKLF